MVSIALKYKEHFDESFPIPIIPLFFVQVNANFDVDAFAQIGYDTRGLREAIAPLYTGGNFDAGKTLDGLWIDPTTHLDLGGDVGLGAGVGIPESRRSPSRET